MNSNAGQRLGDPRALPPDYKWSPGCTIAHLSHDKKIPAGFLWDRGITDTTYQGLPAVRIPVLDRAGHEVVVRYRLHMEKGPDKDDRFRNKQGSVLKGKLYGLERFDRDSSTVVIVEGESNTWTLQFHKFPVLGVLGSNMWSHDAADEIKSARKIVLIVDPDEGGARLARDISETLYSGQALYLVTDLDGHKDVNDLHVAMWDPQVSDRAKRGDNQYQRGPLSQEIRSLAMGDRLPKGLEAF